MVMLAFYGIDFGGGNDSRISYDNGSLEVVVAVTGYSFKKRNKEPLVFHGLTK